MIEISLAHNAARLEGTRAHLDAGAGPARIRIYAGARPAFGAAPAGALLVEITLAKPAGEVTGGVLALAQQDDGLILASGTASWARIVNGEGAVAMDCDVSDDAGSGEIRLPSATLYAGGITRLVSATLG